jgi:hypothetical protein
MMQISYFYSLVRACPIIEQDRKQENISKFIFLNMLMISLDESDPFVHCKRRLSTFPSPARILFPPRESLASDIPAGKEKY